MTKIAELKKKATVLDRNQMKNLVGGEYGPDGIMCVTTVNKIAAHLEYKVGNKNSRAQANLIKSMVVSGELEVNWDC